MKKIKKLTAVFIAVIMALGVLTVAPFTVSAATYGDYEYRLENDYTCTITKYNGYPSNVTIPSEIYGNKVATIGWDAFYENNNLVSVTIPNSVTKIDSYAFDGCNNLSTVKLPSYMKEIGSGVFRGTNLKSVSLPSGIDNVGSGLLSNCKQLVSVGIPNTVKKIDGYAFDSCTALQTISIPNSVKEIRWNVFDNCTSLKSITIGNGLEDFDTDIRNCPLLETISISTSNKFFSSKDGVLFDKNKTEIYFYPQGKKSASYIVPNTVKTLGTNMTNSNQYLKTITIYDNVTNIYDNAIGYIKDGWDYNKINGFTIKGYKGTEAEKYARNNDFNFVALPKPVNPTSVSLNTNSVILGAGESATLTATVQPSNAVKTLTWSSSNTSVATVNNGKVTAKKSGTAYITVKTSNGKTAQCKVTVKPAPTSVKTNPTSVTLGVGETYTISEGTNSGSYANAANLKWSTSNSSVATVTKGSANKATIKATGVGTAYIKITLYNGKTAQCKVTVKPAPTSVKTNPASVTLGKGETYTISESTNSGSYANAANLKWTSSNSSVATVTKGSGNKAVIKAKAKGTAYIRITLYNGKTAQCKVTVK